MPSPHTHKSTFIKALKSPIKMLPHAHGSSAAPNTPLTPTFSPDRPTFLSNGLPVSPSTSHVPEITLQRASGCLCDPFTDMDAAPTTWTCCACGTQNRVSIHSGPHPLGELACDCAHKPCVACSIAGTVKPFLPMDEPAMVPCSYMSTSTSNPASSSEPGKANEKEELRFGILCPACGLSWRARELGKRWSKTLRKMPSVSLQARRLAPEHRLRKSRSTLVLGTKRVITPPGIASDKQAEYAAVRFSGVPCTCGTTIRLRAALCFQIVVLEGGEQIRVDEKEMVVDGRMEMDGGEKTVMWEGSLVAWTTTPELQEKGHGTPTLRLLEGEHPNPLRSSPVVDKMARDSWEEKCDREGWF
ncbi:uncharacterized protein CC84DRAFT_321829 [Paraphaeosphaeria sporulosa]|uniref:Probable double zinc ribbon domain-containing protein n=1 Tax=Paraphaeosphaeria sporulosa TaxID=1460663 RepID=A0A177BZ70_9PLEO|nr:uncharacterized protein CC84DRAFT_321829 [Paraphaeosphaeria sporulosa]OAG00683.1 hypothetical protein CC84DRAFT_321829 [Paraphaeosphaeria sporulosa]